MRHAPKDGKEEEWNAIHEVYYRSNDVDDLTVPVHETSYTIDPVGVISDDVEGLRWNLQKMLEALDKPVLDYSDEG
ncbi:MAG TPA: hypothetical protein VI669_11880 [Vicinamibacteria bacterium]